MKRLNISKFFKKKYGKGDFSIIDDKLVYETEKGDIIEANLPESNKSIKNDMKDEEIEMTKEKQEEKQEDLTKSDDASTMKAKYVKLGENYDKPDPEVVEADRKHIDLKEDGIEGFKSKVRELDRKSEKKKKKNDGAEAGEMEAETPEHKKKKKDGGSYDLMEELKAFKADMASQFETLKKENEVLKKDISEINADKNVEKEAITEDLINGMSDNRMIPVKVMKELKEKYDKYGLGTDFIQDAYEITSYAFGTIPGHEVETKKEDMSTSGLLAKVEGL